MNKTIGLSVLAFVLGAASSFAVGFPLRFLWVGYQHGGLW